MYFCVSLPHREEEKNKILHIIGKKKSAKSHQISAMWKFLTDRKLLPTNNS